MRGAGDFDAIVVGGGPAGSVMAWALAGRGVRVAIVERSVFPREKVCGDFVEPAGLRILDAMGLLDGLAGPGRTPIDANRVYFGPKLVYQGAIAYYENTHGLRPHGLIVPRHELDAAMLGCAEAAGAQVFQSASAQAVRREDGIMRVDVARGETFTLSAPLVLGADGAESLVARSAGLRRADRRHIAVSQRTYVDGVDSPAGEAVIWFDEDIFPGYGWLFPMAGGRANVGVGVLSETCDRHDVSVPRAFAAAIERLRIRLPGCADIRIASRPLGGLVKTYGGIDRNHFDGGLLIGDAGGFVDPMTGEGITQGMESSLIAASTVMDALEQGRFDAATLSTFDRDFRAYFDPSMLYLDLYATVMRNWNLREFWLRAGARGFQEAGLDPEFARVAGASFGGLNLQPLAVIGQLWGRVFSHLARGGAGALFDLLNGRALRAGAAGDLAAWRRGWTASLEQDPAWHVSWLADVARAVARLSPALFNAENPRLRGPLA